MNHGCVGGDVMAAERGSLGPSEEAESQPRVVTQANGDLGRLLGGDLESS